VTKMMLATHLPQTPPLPALADELRDQLDTNLSFSLLRSFVRVVDRTSVSLAARDLSLSQPTVSRHITDLERLYGTALLVRSTRSLNITSAGHCLYEAAQAILESERALTDDIDATRGKLGGPLIISAPPNLGDMVSSFCSEFLTSHECDSISLRVTNVLPCLVAEGVDVAVRVGKVDDVAANVQRAATFKDVLVAPARAAQADVRAHPPARPEAVFVGGTRRHGHQRADQVVPTGPHRAPDGQRAPEDRPPRGTPRSLARGRGSRVDRGIRGAGRHSHRAPGSTASRVASAHVADPDDLRRQGAAHLRPDLGHCVRGVPEPIARIADHLTDLVSVMREPQAR
jgi:DNA-binding transcriptional LysR family regulator